MNKILVFIFFVLLSIFVIYSYAFVDPNLLYMRNIYTGYYSSFRGIISLAYILFIFFFYLMFFYVYLNINLSYKYTFRLLFLIVLLLFFAYPAMLSFDIFNYIATAKVAYFYKENPYIIMPIEFSGDPLLEFMHAPNKVALYGPVWILLTYLPSVFLTVNFLLSLYFFKILSVFFYLLSSFFIFKLSKSYKSVIFYALNPLVLIETVVSGHNDVVMIALALYSIYLLKSRKLFLSFLLLLFSIGIKYATVFLLPVYIYALIKYRKKLSINWEKVYFYSFLSLLIVFLLSPIREEMYPWYSIWFISFASLNIHKNKISIIVTLFSAGLLLRYIPYMYFQNYNFYTKIIRTMIMFIPFVIYPFLLKKIHLPKNV